MKDVPKDHERLSDTGMPQPDFRLLLESAPGLFLILNPDFSIVAVSDAYLNATMRERNALLGLRIFEAFPDNPDDPEATGVRNLRASLERVVRDGVPDSMAVQKYDVARPDSEGGGFVERYWSPSNWPVHGPDGAIAYIIHRVEDVTEFMHLKSQEAEQETLADMLRSRSRQMELEIFQRAQEIQEMNRELRNAKQELELRVSERTLQLARANQALREEIEQSKRLEEQFRQAQKMKAIGTLAGGIAHDFNNLLTVISGYAEILLAMPEIPGPARDLVEQVKFAGSRAAALTRQLLAFSRQQVMERSVVDLNAIVSTTSVMLRRVIGEDVELALILDPLLGSVLADAGQMEQILMNLAVNARDAMPDGGRLSIETANVELDEPYAQGHLDVKPGRYVMLAVSDTGIGMDETTVSRVFEPFFTTKGPGKGTGLGLATVFGIVQQSGGHIWVYSEPANGTTIKIYLPLVEREVSSARLSTVRESVAGTETVLVVEDDAAVRAITTLALKGYGYTVLEAAGGTDAIRICAEYDGPIDILISDVVMPEMGGRRVAEMVSAERPGVRVLFLSGYTDDTVVRFGVLHDEVAFLQKPFTPVSLARKVREVLDA